MSTKFASRRVLPFIAHLLLAIGVLCAFPRKAAAIPAFAREYGVPCDTCHITITRRNEFGDLFRKWGYHWPGDPAQDRAARSAEPVSAESGALFGGGYIPSKVPISVAATMSTTYTNDPAAEHKLTIGSPNLNILLGGTYGDHIGVFGTWSGQGPPNEFFLAVSRVAGRPELNLKVGRFEQATTVFKTNEALLSRYDLGASTIDGHAVSLGRNGLEYSGMFFDRLFLAAGAVEEGDPGSPAAVYYHAGTKVGGLDYAGREPNIDLNGKGSAFDDLVVNIDHWGYRSKVKSHNGADAYLIRRLGLDLKLRYKDVSVWSGAMVGSDGDIAASRMVQNFTWFGEASYQALRWLTFLYLYQAQDSSQAARESQSHDVGAVFLPFENVRLQVKASHSNTLHESAGIQLLMAL